MKYPRIDYKYTGPIFDSHAHVIELEALKLFVEVGKKYGTEKSILIVHGDEIDAYEDMYPGRFVFAKYMSGWRLFTEGPEPSMKEVAHLREDGYSLVKMHFAPFWSDRLEKEKVPSVDSPIFDPLFHALAEHELPLLIHIADPDTYFENRYSDSNQYGTKDEHLEQFENRLKRSSNVVFQQAHFGAQAEPHRLDNLARMFDQYPNLHVDTSSARWMARELGKAPEKAREIIIKHSDRILYGTDCVARTMNEDYYEGRHYTERMIWETDARGVPLPFVDQDTVGKGGTYINGLDLPRRVLDKMYWKNADAIYELD